MWTATDYGSTAVVAHSLSSAAEVLGSDQGRVDQDRAEMVDGGVRVQATHGLPGAHGTVETGIKEALASTRTPASVGTSFVSAVEIPAMRCPPEWGTRYRQFAPLEARA